MNVSGDDVTQLELHPEAVTEIEQARKWYAREASEDIAEAFIVELENALDLIADMPSAWPIRYGIRCFVLRRFPYSVFYRESTETIQIIAVAHQRRRPGYWRQRV